MSLEVSHMTDPSGKEIEVKASEYARYAATSNGSNMIWIADTRNTNESPSWYYSHYGRNVVAEFKFASAVGLSQFSNSVYITIITIAPWNDNSGGSITQIAYDYMNLGQYIRSGLDFPYLILFLFLNFGNSDEQPKAYPCW